MRIYLEDGDGVDCLDLISEMSPTANAAAIEGIRLWCREYGMDEREIMAEVKDYIACCVDDFYGDDQGEQSDFLSLPLE